MYRLPLSAERQRELAVAAERGDDKARRKLVEAFLPAIRGLARRFAAGGRVQRPELVQEGIAGLLFATKRYDPRQGTPFWAYASFWVRKAMQDLLAELSRPVALSDHAVRGLARIRAARRDFLNAHASEPTADQLAAATGITRPQLDRLLVAERVPRWFDEPLGADDAGGAATLGDTIADPRADAEYEHVLDEIEVRDLAARLNDRERAVLWSHYGLGRRATQTLSQIGANLGLTAERVRQIEADALNKLRDAAAEPPGGADGAT
jgi:RNA polymerase primary sigma factor